MRWLVDGYNVIRRSPELASRERESLAAGREALLARLAAAHRASGDRFTVVFDGAGPASAGSAEGAGVTVVFSCARETADRVLVRLAGPGGGAVVSSDREVRRAATRAGAVAVSAEEFLARLPQPGAPGPAARGGPGRAPPGARGLGQGRGGGGEADRPPEGQPPAPPPPPAGPGARAPPAGPEARDRLRAVSGARAGRRRGRAAPTP